MRIGRRGRRSTQTPAGSVKKDERQELDRREQADLEGARVEQEDRDDRDRELADLRAEQRDRRRGPELAVVGRRRSRLWRGAVNGTSLAAVGPC